MTQEQYDLKLHQVSVLDSLLDEFRGNTSLNTIRYSLIAQCKLHEERNNIINNH